MYVSPLRGRLPVTRILLVAALLAVSVSCATAIAASGSSKLHLAGKWSGTYSGAFSGKFHIQWKQSGSRLSGSITLSNPQGTYGITGAVNGRAIKFGAVGVGATYTGSASSSKMSGRYSSPQGGGSWSAHKCKPRTVC
jgi:hypothetical protein